MHIYVELTFGLSDWKIKSIFSLKKKRHLEVITTRSIIVFVPYETKDTAPKDDREGEADPDRFEVKTAAVMFQLQQNSWKREFMTVLWTLPGWKEHLA